MTVPAPVVAPESDELTDHTVQRVDTGLRDAAARLGAGPNITPADVQVAQLTIGAAERALGTLVHDPWEPSVVPIRHAREILSSHLLAAAACEGADVAAPVTARVLRRGAESARRVLAAHEPNGRRPEPHL